MNLRLSTLCFVLVGATCLAQVPATMPAASAVPERPPSVGNPSAVPVLPDLDRLQTAASQTKLDLGHLRIDKWKADPESKRQAQANADSVQRNLTSALPGLIDAVRSAPQDLTAQFKLYRNLNALYDVLISLTESTGAFGPKSDYEALGQQLETIDSVRRDLGDQLEQMTSSTQAELSRLRSQVRTYQQAAATAAAATPPKKVVVDDTEPAKKTVHKKKKPAASSMATSASDTANTSTKDSTSTGTGTPAPKP